MVLQGNFPRGKGKLQIKKKKEEQEEGSTDNKNVSKKNHKRFFDTTDEDETLAFEEHEKHTKKLKNQTKILNQGCIYKHKRSGAITINSIKFNDLSNTMKVLCAIKSLEDDYVIVSLPNMLTGYYYQDDDNEISLKKLYKYLSNVCTVSITSTCTSSTKRKIEVSFDPIDVNAGITYDTLYTKQILRSRIVSVEDYGYIVDIGIMGVVSFLKTDKTDDLYVGSILDLQISKLDDDNKSITLGFVEDKQIETDLSISNVDLHTLQPGNLVRFHVEEYCTNGIIIGFHNSNSNIFQGAIELSQLVPSEQQSSWKKHWNEYRSKTKRLVGRILCMDSYSKILRLSVLPHIMTLTQQPKVSDNLPEYGDILQDLEIVRIDKGFGLLAIYPLNSTENDEVLNDDELSYTMDDINTNDFSDDNTEKSTHQQPSNYASIYILTKNESYEEGSKLSQVRILSKTKWIMDDYIEGSIDASILNASIFSYDQLQFGHVYKCTITRVYVDTLTNNVKLYVSLGPNLTGIITSQHFYDKGYISSYKLQALVKKYKEGMVLKAKYVNVDDYNNHYMTIKPSLLKSSQQFDNYNTLNINDVSVGIVSKKDKNKGIHVMFYNTVHGILPLYDVVAQLGKDWYDVYDLGDVLKCRIVKIETFPNESRRLVLSLNVSAHNKNDDENDVPAVVPVGTILEKDVMKVYDVTSKDIKVIIKSKNINNSLSNSEEIVGSIPFNQLFDTNSTIDEIEDLVKELYPIGTRIQSKGVVLENKTNDMTAVLPYVIISLRSSFIHTMEINNSDDESDSDDDEVDDDAESVTNEKKSTTILLPSSYAQCTKNTLLIGCIYNIDERYGTFIKYLNGITGFIPKKTNFNGVVNNTIVGQVLTIDVDTKRLVVKPKLDVTEKIIQESYRECKCAISDMIHVKITSNHNIRNGTAQVKAIDNADVKGILPGLEISKDLKILQNLTKHYPIGKILQVRIIDKIIEKDEFDEDEEDELLVVSLLNATKIEVPNVINLPKIGQIVVGRINRKLRNIVPCSILIDVRNLHGYGRNNNDTTSSSRCYVRCCITELMDVDDWTINEPIGKLVNRKDHGLFPHGKYVHVKIVSYPIYQSKTIIPPIMYLDGTLRPSQLLQQEQSKEDTLNSIPQIGDEIKGYVVKKNSTESIVYATPTKTTIGGNIICRIIPGKRQYPMGSLVSGIVKDVVDLMNGDIGVQLDTSAIDE